MVSLTIRTKSSEPCAVDHVDRSGNLCQTTTPGANEGVVAVQTDEHPCREGCSGLAASRNRPRMPMHERLVNIISTRKFAIHKGRPGMQRLPGDRSWTVSRAARSEDYDRPQRRTKAKPSIVLCVGDRRKSKKIPGEHNCTYSVLRFCFRCFYTEKTH